MSGLFSNLFKFVGKTIQQVSYRQFHALPTTVSGNAAVGPTITNPWSFDLVRNIIRENLPKASERKRLKAHGWRVRLKTKNGRRVIMRRILKGRYYLAH